MPKVRPMYRVVQHVCKDLGDDLHASGWEPIAYFTNKYDADAFASETYNDSRWVETDEGRVGVIEIEPMELKDVGPSEMQER